MSNRHTILATMTAMLLAACGSDVMPFGYRSDDAGPGKSGGAGGASGAGAAPASGMRGVGRTGGAPGSSGASGSSGSSGGDGGAAAATGGSVSAGGSNSSGGTAGTASGGGLAINDAGPDATPGTPDATPASPDATPASPDATPASPDANPGTPDPAFLARPCLEPSDCGPGLQCLTSSSNAFGGGIANGFCTLDCSRDLVSPIPAESVCATISSTAICLQVSQTKAYCTESCPVGPLAPGQTKCRDRQDLACTDPTSTGDGYCKPTCRGDFDCAGRVCDLETGLCQDSIDPARKLPIGTKCNPTAAFDPCEGSCVTIDGQTATSVGFCSGFCPLGTATNCGADPLSTAPPSAYCLFGVSTDSDVGDLGFCAQLCDCNDDCSSRDLICDRVAGLEAAVGRLGACTLPTAANGDPSGVACH